MLAFLLAVSPLPRTSTICPIGYYPISNYCVPHARTTQQAFPKSDTICPPGSNPQLTYCLER